MGVGAILMKCTIENIMKLRRIREYWSQLTWQEKEDIWRDYNNYSKEREIIEYYVLDRWFATLDDGDKIRRYRHWIK